MSILAQLLSQYTPKMDVKKSSAGRKKKYYYKKKKFKEGYISTWEFYCKFDLGIQYNTFCEYLRVNLGSGSVTINGIEIKYFKDTRYQLLA